MCNQNLLIKKLIQKLSQSVCYTIQVRLGTETGSKVVKMAVLGLYWLVLGLGLAKTLPYSCVVSLATSNNLFS